MRALLALVILAATSLGAYAQSWPTQTVRLVVPFSAGGPSDIVARIVGDEMGRQLNQPVIVENRPGAGSAVGSASVAKADRDGHTILFTTNSLSLMTSLMTNLTFDPQADFTPVALIGTSSYILATNKEFPARTLSEVLSLVRSNPNKFNFGTAGVGSGMHFAFEFFMATAGGLKMIHVPYRGGAAVMAALISGEVHLVTDPTPEALPYIQGGNVRGIAVSSRDRLPSLPDMPTFAESGVAEFKQFEARGWHMMLVPAGTPASLVGTINNAINTALTSPRVAKRLTDMSIDVPRDNSPEATARFLNGEFHLWGEVAKKAGIKPM